MISECQEFAPVALGDARQRQRLVTIATGLAAHPDGTLHQDCANWAELKAAYGPIPQPQPPGTLRTRNALPLPLPTIRTWK